MSATAFQRLRREKEKAKLEALKPEESKKKKTTKAKDAE